MNQKFSGKVWLLGDDIDTDIIIPTEYLAMASVEEMAPYAFSPLRADLAGQIQPGDVVVAGKNFGCGSSREQAPEVLKALGLGAIIAKSYARIFYRNALNNGLLLLENKDLPDAVKEGDVVDVFPGEKLVHDGNSYSLAPMAENLKAILENGGLVETARRQNSGEAPVEKQEETKKIDVSTGKNTLIEKIIGRNANHAVQSGQTVTVTPQRVMIHDIFVPFVAEKFKQMGFTKIHDPDSVVLIYDHLVPAATIDDVRHFKTGDAFAKEYGLKNVHRSDGICHQLMVEAGYVKPGDVAFGTDSHTTTYGAVGAFSTGIGYTEMASVLGTGKLWVRVPESIKVQIDGTMPKNVSAKDIILKLLGDIGADGAVYQALEFCGSTVEEMSLSSRMTIANMAVEAGAKCAVFVPDEKSLEYCKETNADIEYLRPDEGAQYSRVIQYKAEDLKPVMACPSQVDNVKPVKELLGIKVDQVFIGSCTNGRLEDLKAAADVLKGESISPFTRLVVTPASREIYTQAAENGILETLIAAGATVTLPGCGLCCGRTAGILASEEVVVATNNRNFMGRMGDSSVQIYLASPVVAAHAAIKGEIVLPE